MISSMWKNETDAVRAEYERRADAKKAEHQQLYPGYRFQPMKKEDKDRIRTEKRTEKEKERSQSRRPRNRPIPYAPGNFTPPPLPPIIPVYQPQSHYGPTGPSPPLSAASSPEDDSPLREARPRAKSTSVSNNARPKSPLSSASPHDLFSSIPIAAPSPERDVTRLVAQRPPRNPQKWPTPHATVNGVPTERPIARSPPPPLNPPRNKVRYGAGNAQVAAIPLCLLALTHSTVLTRMSQRSQCPSHRKVFQNGHWTMSLPSKPCCLPPKIPPYFSSRISIPNFCSRRRRESSRCRWVRSSWDRTACRRRLSTRISPKTCMACSTFRRQVHRRVPSTFPALCPAQT
jgi:hypothetical protein